MKKIDRRDLVKTVEDLKNSGFDYLEKITAVDYKTYLEVDYFLLDMDNRKEEMLKVSLEVNDAWIPTIAHIFKSANWHEREVSEMFGINIGDYPAPRLLIEKWDGVDPPLRKSFTWNAQYKSLD